MGGTIHTVNMDFMKAFNNVPHHQLIGKLWKQRVHVNGQFSKWSTVSSVIPQGSVLDPFLFVILIMMCGTHCFRYYPLFRRQ